MRKRSAEKRFRAVFMSLYVCARNIAGTDYGNETQYDNVLDIEFDTIPELAVDIENIYGLFGRDLSYYKSPAQWSPRQDGGEIRVDVELLKYNDDKGFYEAMSQAELDLWHNYSVEGYRARIYIMVERASKLSSKELVNDLYLGGYRFEGRDW